VRWFFEHSILSRMKIKDLNFFDFDKKLTKLGQFFIFFPFSSVFSMYAESNFLQENQQIFCLNLFHLGYYKIHHSVFCITLPLKLSGPDESKNFFLRIRRIRGKNFSVHGEYLGCI
jgi:hypothetical protein